MKKDLWKPEPTFESDEKTFKLGQYLTYIFGFSLKGRYLGKVEGNRFVFMWFQLGKRNSWAPVLGRTVKPASRGSVIRAYFDIINFTKIFTVVWILGLTMIDLSIPFMPFLPGESQHNMPTFFPLGMALFVLFIAHLGQFLGKSDCKKSIELLKEIARP